MIYDDGIIVRSTANIENGDVVKILPPGAIVRATGKVSPRERQGGILGDRIRRGAEEDTHRGMDRKFGGETQREAEREAERHTWREGGRGAMRESEREREGVDPSNIVRREVGHGMIVSTSYEGMQCVVDAYTQTSEESSRNVR